MQGEINNVEEEMVKTNVKLNTRMTEMNKEIKGINVKIVNIEINEKKGEDMEARMDERLRKLEQAIKHSAKIGNRNNELRQLERSLRDGEAVQTFQREGHRKETTERNAQKEKDTSKEVIVAGQADSPGRNF